jgi:SAM-dependent methyltransferase
VGVFRKDHRAATLSLLRGSGLEIGALESPCPVPRGCRVTYCDVHPIAVTRALFPELASLRLQAPDVLVDLNREGLTAFGDATQDFVILNHVIEHVASPLAVVGELFRVLRPAGHLVIAVPDARYTFDRGRDKTTFEHLLAEKEAGVTEVSLEHFDDLIRLHSPEIAAAGEGAVAARAEELRRRAEHAHVWDGPTFRDFLERALVHFGVAARFAAEFSAETTGHEYFAVLQKLPG